MASKATEGRYQLCTSTWVHPSQSFPGVRFTAVLCCMQRNHCVAYDVLGKRGLYAPVSHVVLARPCGLHLRSDVIALHSAIQ